MIKIAEYHAEGIQLQKIMLSLPFLLLLLLFGLFTSCNSGSETGKLSGSIDTLQKKEYANPYTTNDQSPMDIGYFPQDYPVLKMNGTTDSGGLLARVIYSRPQKKGRVIFGSSPRTLCQYGKEWRLGANESSEIEFFKDVMINNKKIIKGRYVIYCIPYPEKWSIILNTNLFTWGLHMDKTKDIFNIDVPTSLQSPLLEDFTMVFEPADNGANLIMAWDNVKAILPIKTNL